MTKYLLLKTKFQMTFTWKYDYMHKGEPTSSAYSLYHAAAKLCVLKQTAHKHSSKHVHVSHTVQAQGAQSTLCCCLRL